MIRSSLSIDGLSDIADNNITSYTVSVLSPKSAVKCWYCCSWMEKCRWFSISPKGQDPTFYCSFKCMWISTHDSYRKFEHHWKNGSIIVVHRIKQCVPVSLGQSTSTLKADQVDSERAAAEDSITKFIAAEGHRVSLIRTPRIIKAKKRCAASVWMRTHRNLWEFVYGTSPSSQRPKDGEAFPAELVLDNERATK